MSRDWKSNAQRRIDRVPLGKAPTGRPRGVHDAKDMIHAQAKLMRLMELIMVLQASRLTITELAERFGHSERTVYRYLALLESLDFGVEQDFKGRYFIVEGNACPLCGASHKPGRSHG